MTWLKDPVRQACWHPKAPMYSSHPGAGSVPRAAGRHDRKWPAQQRGAFEFVLILPILLGLLVGGIDASMALYDKAVITKASREGARAGIVARNPQLSDAQIRQVVNQYAQSSLVSFGTNPVQPTVLIQKGRLGDDPTLQVTVSYTFEGIGLGSLLQSLGRPWVLQASTVLIDE